MTKQVLIENFKLNFFFKLSINEMHVYHVLKFNFSIFLSLLVAFLEDKGSDQGDGKDFEI